MIKFEKLFHTHTLAVVVVVTYSFSPYVPPSQRACTSCATLSLCVSKNRCISRTLSTHICIGTFCASLFLGASSRSLVFLEAAVLCPSTLLGSRINQGSKNLRHTGGKKTFLTSLFSSCTKVVTLVKFFHRIHVSSKLLCPWKWHKLSASFLSPCSGTCPSASAQIAANTCWWDKSSICVCYVILLAELKRIRAFRCNSVVSFFGSPSQLLLVIAKSRLANSFWHASSGKSSFSAKTAVCLVWLL